MCGGGGEGSSKVWPQMQCISVFLKKRLLLILMLHTLLCKPLFPSHIGTTQTHFCLPIHSTSMGFNLGLDINVLATTCIFFSVFLLANRFWIPQKSSHPSKNQTGMAVSPNSTASHHIHTFKLSYNHVLPHTAVWFCHKIYHTTHIHRQEFRQHYPHHFWCISPLVP